MERSNRRTLIAALGINASLLGHRLVCLWCDSFTNH